MYIKSPSSQMLQQFDYIFYEEYIPVFFSLE